MMGAQENGKDRENHFPRFRFLLFFACHNRLTVILFQCWQPVYSFPDIPCRMETKLIDLPWPLWTTMDDIVIFQQFPLKAGQKIRINDGPRRGDWLVIGVTERKIALRCPVSGREVEWDRFCYHVETRDDLPWPHHD